MSRCLHDTGSSQEASQRGDICVTCPLNREYAPTWRCYKGCTVDRDAATNRGAGALGQGNVRPLVCVDGGATPHSVVESIVFESGVADVNVRHGRGVDAPRVVKEVATSC